MSPINPVTRAGIHIGNTAAGHELQRTKIWKGGHSFRSTFSLPTSMCAVIAAVAAVMWAAGESVLGLDL